MGPVPSLWSGLSDNDLERHVYRPRAGTLATTRTDLGINNIPPKGCSYGLCLLSGWTNTSVPPMREQAVRKLLSKARSDWHLVQRLGNERQLIQRKYQGGKFYVCCLE